MSSKKFTCPACSGNNCREIYCLNKIPVHSCVLLDNPGDAKRFPCADLQLAFCHGCGFIYNSVFDESLQDYSGDFEESQHFSGTFEAFADSLVKRISTKRDLTGKHVLEIGCGRGEFLCRLCSRTGSTGTGIDPGYYEDPDRLERSSDTQFIADYFGKEYYHLDADLIICRHTLEHIGKVREFVRSVRLMIGDRDDILVFFETPDAARILKEGAFWDIYYEHCSYFSAGSHARLFRQELFDIDDLRLVFGGQYINQFARPSSSLTSSVMSLENDLETMRHLSTGFPEIVDTKIHEWQLIIGSAQRSGTGVALWGGGSKAVSFLTTLNMYSGVDLVIDINPYKQGKYLPGSGLKVDAPEVLKSSSIGLIIVMNPVYADEIRGYLDANGIKAVLRALQ